MKPAQRKLRKWRKTSPSKSRSYAEKRDRLFKYSEKEMKEYEDRISKRNIRKGENDTGEY